MRRLATLLVACALPGVAMLARAAIDVDALWNYADPAASETRFRQALAGATGDDALVLRTQIARTYSLRARFDEAQRELDEIEPALAAAGVESRVRGPWCRDARGFAAARRGRWSGRPPPVW